MQRACSWSWKVWLVLAMLVLILTGGVIGAVVLLSAPNVTPGDAFTVEQGDIQG